MKQLSLPEDVRWIGAERPQGGFPIETSYFKTVFIMNGQPDTSTIHISANSRYCLYVNGREIINGPCKGDNWHQYCDAVDIAPYLTPGKNIVAAKVTAYPPFEATNDDYSNFGPIWSMSNSAGPMLIVWGELGGADISTGRAAWFCKNDTAIQWKIQPIAHWMGCAEEVDGAKIPHGWQSEQEIGDDFKPVKVKWNNQVRFGEVPRLFLYERPIKQLLRLDNNALAVMDGTGNFPLPAGGGETVLPANGVYEIMLDAGRLTTSFVYLDCKNGAGSRVSLLYSEAFSHYDGKQYYKEKRSDTSGELRGVTDIYCPGGGDETYSPSWFRTFRFIKITAETGESPLTLYPPRLIETRYPLENRVRFDASQPWVKNVWDISLRTLELCMHESYEDCPFYEQLQYTMDTRLQMLFTYSVGSGADMPLKTIHDFHTSMLPEGILQSRFPSKYPQVIPAFSLHWIFMLKDYYMETGDLAILERYRPTMESVLAWYKRKTGPQGLVEYLGYWDFADWAEAWGDIAGTPRAALHGPSTIGNLAYAYALETGAFIMDALGLGLLADSFRNEKKGILENIQNLCWSRERNLYREGPDFEEYSQHAQLWAVLSGLVSGNKAREIMRIVLSDKTLIPCSFVMQFYLFRALEEAGMYEETEQLWELWKDLIGLDLTTVPEIPGKYTRSDCHAWGALILHELPRKFLGVQPLTPGYGRVSIRPMGLYMGEISGEVPTPRGMVSVGWSTAGGQYKIEGNTPVPAEVILPDGSKHEVMGSYTYNCAI